MQEIRGVREAIPASLRLMERESRHSKEEEEELDRKIAQIREKNQRIEERQKEIAADRANHSDEPQRKPSKPSPPNTGASKTSKGEWDREWDHGKTPAETWRENVPSIETRKKPSGHGSQPWSVNHRGRRGGHKTRGRSEETNHQAAKGSRLDGRVTVNQESNHNQRGGRGRGGRHQQGDRHVTNTDGELKAVVKNADGKSAPPKHQRNMRRSAKISTSSKDESAAQNSSGKNRPRRRYTDKYEIKQLLRALVNKVEKAERKERQKLRQLKEGSNVEESKTPPKEDPPKTSSEESKTPPKEDQQKASQQLASESTPEKTDAKASNGEVAAESPKEAATPPQPSKEATLPAEPIKSVEQKAQEPPKSAPKESGPLPLPIASATAAADANQNVIKLVEEKVIQIQMS